MDEKLFCNSCKGLRNHKDLAEKRIDGGEEDHNYWWTEQYKIIQCLGCDNVSFLKVFSDNSMIRPLDDYDYEYYDEKTIYPNYLIKGNEIRYIYYLPEKIKQIYIETISAFKSKAYILTAGGLRAIIEALCNHLKIIGKNLDERIELLHNKGHLTIDEAKRLHSIRFLGNDALHEMQVPSIEQLVTLLEIINHLLSNLFINDKLLKGKIDTIIDDFDEFYRFFQSIITQEMLNETIDLKILLGKSLRRISKGKIDSFIDILNNKIKSGEIKFLELIVFQNKRVQYKIIEKPDLGFFWD